MADIIEGPASVGMVFHADGTTMGAHANPTNSGSISLTIWKDGWEVADFAIFTHDAALSMDLAVAINAALHKHGRLDKDVKFGRADVGKAAA